MKVAGHLAVERADVGLKRELSALLLRCQDQNSPVHSTEAFWICEQLLDRHPFTGRDLLVILLGWQRIREYAELVMNGKKGMS